MPANVLFRNLGFLDFPEYEVGTDGSVWSFHSGQCRRMNPWVNRAGYLVVTLKSKGRYRNCLINRLVLLAFVGEPDPGQVTRHLDGDPTNNWLGNLVWGTETENAADRRRHGTLLRGSDVGNSKLREDDVAAIRAAYLAGESQRAIAARFGVCQQTVSHVVRDKTWAHTSAGQDDSSLKTRASVGRSHRGSKNPRARLRDDDVLELLRLYTSGGWTRRKLAERFGIGLSMVHNILSGKAWKHIHEHINW